MDILTTRDAAKLVLRPVAPQTINNWMRRGVAGIRLEHQVIGGRRITTREALDSFITKLDAIRGNGKGGADA
jgi:hypothetical protein